MIKIVTYFPVLLKLARAEYNAKINGTKEEYEYAKQQHEAYKDLCLRADEMITGINRCVL